jgi:hypothetical protein
MVILRATSILRGQKGDTRVIYNITPHLMISYSNVIIFFFFFFSFFFLLLARLFLLYTSYLLKGALRF